MNPKCVVSMLFTNYIYSEEGMTSWTAIKMDGQLKSMYFFLLVLKQLSYLAIKSQSEDTGFRNQEKNRLRESWRASQ